MRQSHAHREQKRNSGETRNHTMRSTAEFVCQTRFTFVTWDMAAHWRLSRQWSPHQAERYATNWGLGLGFEPLAVTCGRGGLG
jgi:hypothetical protein